MPCRRATSCAIAPQPTGHPFEAAPFSGTWLAYRLRAHVSYSIAATSRRRRHLAGHGTRRPADRRPLQSPASYPDPVSTASSPHDPHLATPTGKPRARAVGLKYQGTPGRNNAITDVPGVEVGYQTLIENDNVRTGVTAIHPRGKRNPGDPLSAGYFSLNGNGEMTGVSWIEESGTMQGPVVITNTHAVGIAHAGIIAWMNQAHPDSPTVAAARRGGDLGRLPQRHQRPPCQRGARHPGPPACHGDQPDEGSVGGGTGMNCYPFKGGTARRRAWSTTRHDLHRRRLPASQLRPPRGTHDQRRPPRRGTRGRQPDGRLATRPRRGPGRYRRCRDRRTAFPESVQGHGPARNPGPRSHRHHRLALFGRHLPCGLHRQPRRVHGRYPAA